MNGETLSEFILRTALPTPALELEHRQEYFSFDLNYNCVLKSEFDKHLERDVERLRRGLCFHSREDAEQALVVLNTVFERNTRPQ